MSEQEIRRILSIKLRECREKAGLTAREAGSAIGKSEKTISAWEHGRGQPDADMLFALCKLYGIEDISVFYGMHNDARSITAEEMSLLQFFRSLNGPGRKLLLSTAESFAGTPDMQKEAPNETAM